MPTYVYRCDNCGAIFERFESITSEPTQVCSKCGSVAHRLMTAGGGLIFKGSGFYVTDYKHSHSSSPPSEKSESKASDSKGKSDESKK